MKPRSDNRLASLPPAQKAQLRAWLGEENKSYAEVRDLLRERFGVAAGITAIRRFYATDTFALRSHEASEFAVRVVEEFQKTSPQAFDTATLALIRQKAFERAYAREGSVDELAILAKIIGDSAKLDLKRRDQELAERRVKLLEKKAAQADQAEQATRDPALTPAQREARLKEIFGLK